MSYLHGQITLGELAAMRDTLMSAERDINHLCGAEAVAIRKAISVLVAIIDGKPILRQKPIRKGSL